MATPNTISSKKLVAALAFIEADQRSRTVKPKTSTADDLAARLRKINEVGLYLERLRGVSHRFRLVHRPEACG